MIKLEKKRKKKVTLTVLPDLGTGKTRQRKAVPWTCSQVAILPGSVARTAFSKATCACSFPVTTPGTKEPSISVANPQIVQPRKFRN